VGRYGGEEFVVCLPGIDVSQGESVAERMRMKTEETRIVTHDNSPPIQITASFGVAFFQTGYNDTVDSLIGRADKALYLAKREGRNRACLE
jgi:two-component system cell cycle response regulator